jgi:hypothetical protein
MYNLKFVVGSGEREEENALALVGVALNTKIAWRYGFP